ncbi:MAG: CFI-box-CTERM domain-containing protein [Halobacteriales archaeon]
MGEDTTAGRDDEPPSDGIERRTTHADSDTVTDDPVEVGDFREKHIRIVTDHGEEIDHSSVYLKHSATEFIVSQDPEFPDDETIRYQKAEIANVEITQHHSACFITTATAGDGPTLDRLRGFRDDALRTTPIGRLCIVVYYAVSPPIAATLRRHPRSSPTRLVRWLIQQCGRLAVRRDRSRSAATRAAWSVVLVGLYILGILLATLGHFGLRCCEFGCVDHRL